jgi:methyl-accepting chemotaxis protein
LYELYKKGGLKRPTSVIAADVDVEEALLNDRDYWLGRLGEHQLAFLLVDEEGKPIVGLPDLAEAEVGWSWRKISIGEDPSLEIFEVLVRRHSFANQHALLIGKPRSYEFQTTFKVIQIRLFWLLMVIVPLAILTGYLLSHRVVRRIEGLSEGIEAIGSGTLSKRLPLVGGHDEFDRLSKNVNAMLDRIEALHGNIKGVSVGIAHDLKTPLTRLFHRMQLMACCV